MKVQIKDLIDIYENEVKKNVKNKKKIFEFERNKMEYFVDMKSKLENNEYDGGKYTIFLIFEPKVRVVMSQSIYDKVINHYVTRFILEPKLTKYLNNRNCATRKNMGITYAIDLFKKDIEKFKKHEKFYFLKIDISKYFYTINHDVLKSNLINELDHDEYNLMCKIIDSTNKPYINNIISKLEKKNNLILPKYNYNEGLPIGNLTSQFLAIFYLSKLQHYILNDLHITYVNFMDDYVLIHESKEYLKYSLRVIIEKLEKEYKLKVNNKKTFIKNSKGGITFLGYLFLVKNKKTIIKITSSAKRNIRKGIKKTRCLYNNNFIDFKRYFCSIMSYKKGRKYISQRKINEIITNIG